MIEKALLAMLLLGAATTAAAPEAADARLAFFERLSSLCGTSFEGVSSFPEDGPFTGKLLVAEIKDCDEDEIRIPFAVGDDRSRTWIVTRSDRGLLLKHDHRHADGTPDEVTMYGGWATDGGSDLRQSFAADDHTKEAIPEATTNVWTLELDEESTELTYYLERHAKPRFKATLTRRAVAGAEIWVDPMPAMHRSAGFPGGGSTHTRCRENPGSSRERRALVAGAATG